MWFRSLVTLKALTYAPYRWHCGSGDHFSARDSRRRAELGLSLLLDARRDIHALRLMTGGYLEEARAWREWLLRAVAGKPSQLQIMYGLAGERRLTEMEIDWLPGYERSRPVRVGNAAYRQFQLDVFGEVMDAFHFARRSGLDPEAHAWRIQRVLMDFLESAWEQADEGIWEVRGPRRHFTHSKVMAWVAFDRRCQGCGSSPAWMARWTAGGAYGTISTEMFAARGLTRSGKLSCSTTEPRSRMQACL